MRNSSGGNLVFAKQRSKSIHSTTREHLTVLTCINAEGESIPNFYTFKGQRREYDYIALYIHGVATFVQVNA